MKWKPYFARAGKGLAFFLIAALLFCLITRIFTPKWSGYWKSSDTLTGFYQLEEDSIDTLIIGSSQVMSGSRCSAPTPCSRRRWIPSPT